MSIVRHKRILNFKMKRKCITVLVCICAQTLAFAFPLLPSGQELVFEVSGWVKAKGTGGRLWPAATTLAKHLCITDASRGSRVIELGSGTGAVGIFAAALGSPSVVLSDHNRLALSSAQRNVKANRKLLRDAKVRTVKYSWGDPIGELVDDFDGARGLVLGSDITFERKSHATLCQTLADLVGTNRFARCALLAHQHREFAYFGVSQLDHFLEIALLHDLHVDINRADTETSILKVSRLSEL